ncbi:hypothetical protein [Bradyrhizobium sp. USDA 4473]
MSHAAHDFKRTNLTRAILAVQKAGLQPTHAQIDKDGKITIALAASVVPVPVPEDVAKHQMIAAE